MKILHVITGLETGGAERALYNLLQGGLSVEFESYVISLSDMGTIGPQIETLGVPVTALGMRSGRPTLASVFKLRNIIKDFQPDLIQGWMYHGNLVASLARFFFTRDAAVVWNVRQSVYDLNSEKRTTRLVINANAYFSKSPDILLYNSQLSRKQHEALDFSADNGLVIPNGINLQQFTFSRLDRLAVRKEMGVPADALVVGHVARFHPMKDHALFLRVARSFVKSLPNVHFILSGRGVDWNEIGLSQEVPVEFRGQIHLLGERADVPALMSTMDVFCLSSWSEAFPNVLGEAMAVGLPCVTTDVGDSAMVVGDCGVVVFPSDQSALTVGIDWLLSLSIDERQKLGQKARERIEKNFTLSAIVKRYVDLYNSLI